MENVPIICYVQFNFSTKYPVPISVIFSKGLNGIINSYI